MDSSKLVHSDTDLIKKENWTNKFLNKYGVSLCLVSFIRKVRDQLTPREVTF